MKYIRRIYNKYTTTYIIYELRVSHLRTVNLHRFFRIFVIRPVQRPGVLGKLMDLLQGSRVEHTVRMVLVDHTENHHVMQRHLLFHPVVKDPDRFLAGQHVLWIGVHLHGMEKGKC